MNKSKKFNTIILYFIAIVMCIAINNILPLILVIIYKVIKSGKDKKTITPTAKTKTVSETKTTTKVSSKNDNSPIVKPDTKYNPNEKIILKNMVKAELSKHHASKLITESLNRRINISLLVLGLITIVNVILFYLNYSVAIPIVIEIISIIIYLIIYKNANGLNNITSYLIKHPDEDITKTVNENISKKTTSNMNPNLKLLIILVITLILPSLYFVKPKIFYTKMDNGYYISKYSRGITSPDKITIENKHKGKDILGIRSRAFKNAKMTNITLPDTIESIGSHAFYNCKNLKEITIPKNVTEIRASAFENNENLEKVILNDNLKEIRANAFGNDYSLVDIKLPDSLEYLGAAAFSHCTSLEKIKIPKKVTEINGETFKYCISLENIELHDDIIAIHGEAFSDNLSLKEIVLPNKIKEIKGNTFEGCTALTSIKIPHGVERIGGHAFYGCTALKEVTVPSTVKEIGSSAFRCCDSLDEISIPKDAYVNERAFKESPTIINRY